MTIIKYKWDSDNFFYVRCYISWFPISFHCCINHPDLHPDLSSSSNSHWYLTVFMLSETQGQQKCLHQNLSGVCCLLLTVMCKSFMMASGVACSPYYQVAEVLTQEPCWCRLSSHVNAVPGEWLTGVWRESVVFRDQSWAHILSIASYSSSETENLKTRGELTRAWTIRSKNHPIATWSL